jgi:hypothetical protein
MIVKSALTGFYTAVCEECNKVTTLIKSLTLGEAVLAAKEKGWVISSDILCFECKPTIH